MKLLSLKTKANFKKTKSLKTTLENMSIFKKLSNFTKLTAIISLVFGFNMNQALAEIFPDPGNSFTGSVVIDGSLTVAGGVNGDLTGNVTGNLTGDVTGDVTGDLTGNVTGNVTGDLTGNVTGNLTGDVTGDVRSANGVVILNSGTNGLDASISGLESLSVDSNGATADGNTLVVDNTSTRVGGQFQVDSNGAAAGGNTLSVNANGIQAAGNFTISSSGDGRGSFAVDQDQVTFSSTAIGLNLNGGNENNDTVTNRVSSTDGATTISAFVDLDGGGVDYTNSISVRESRDETINGRTTSFGTDISGGLRVDDIVITNNFVVDGHTSLDTLSTEGQATLNSLFVNTTSRFTGDITADANYNSTNGNITLTNGTVSAQNLVSTGVATLDSLEVTNGATINGALGVVGDIASQDGNVELENGDVNLTNGNINLANGDLAVGGKTTLTGLLDANGGANLSIDADGAGIGTLRNSIEVVENVSVTIDGAATTIGTDVDGGLRTDRLIVEGDTQIGEDLEVVGNLDVKNGATIALNDNRLTVGADNPNTFNSNLGSNRTLTSGTDIKGGLNVGGTFAASTDTDNNLTFGARRNVSVGGVDVLSGTSVVGGLTSDTLGITGNARIGGTLNTTGLLTAAGGAEVSSGFAAYSEAEAAGNSIIADVTSSRLTSANASARVAVNDAASTMAFGNNNSIIVDSTSSRMVYNNNDIVNSVVVGNTQQVQIGANTSNYGTAVNGGMYVNGDLAVNGNVNIRSANANADASVEVANNGLNIAGATNTVTLTSDGNNNINDGGSRVSLETTQASLTLVNTDGKSHGITVSNNQTVISGGTSTGVLTLNNDGATFSDSNGAPTKVTGVANGTSTYDAVNYGQLTKGLNEVRSGISAVSAMANIPQVEPNKKFALGAGYGTFMNTQAFAVGGSARIDDSVIVKASFAQSTNAKPTFGVGVGYSW